MTNHIEELMKAAGVECSTMCKPIGANCKAGCDNCERRKVFYPAFTPEKQLELIKLIGLERGFQIHQNEGFDWILSESIYVDLSFNTQGYSYSSFENALCDLTVNLLEKNAIEKSKVRRILSE